MAFWGEEFIFNNIPSSDFDLMIYDFNNQTSGDGEFASVVDIVEEVVGTRWRPHFYGTKFENKLEIEIVFGVNAQRLDQEKYLDRYELSEIATWLTGHDRYLDFQIEQEDMHHVRYKCIVTSLDIVSYKDVPWALKAKLECDSPYAYMFPQEFVYEVDGSQLINLFNDSSINGYYYPKVVIEGITGGDISITNITDNNREFKLTGMPASVLSVTIDNDNCVITNNQDFNLYEYCNFKFLRLRRGYNTIKVDGSCTIRFICEFPVNTGG